MDGPQKKKDAGYRSSMATQVVLTQAGNSESADH